jgi:hypothetical protein
MAEVSIHPTDIARHLAGDSDMTEGNYKRLIGFVDNLDEFVSDLEFTVALRDRLNEIIEECSS